MSLESELLALVEPIIERSKDLVGTHSTNCHEYHVACLAVAIKYRILNTSEADGGVASDCRHLNCDPMRGGWKCVDCGAHLSDETVRAIVAANRSSDTGEES